LQDILDSPGAKAFTPEQLELFRRLNEIFMPFANRTRTAMIERKGRFVHYTSAANALEIIRTKRLWMRNTNCMSDYREVQHGFETLNKFFADASKQQIFLAALDACAKGVGQQAIQLFNQCWNDIRFNTFIASLSEHIDAEDQHGRLSMWRAFARASPRVALVIRLPLADRSAGSSLRLLLSPVAYHTDAQVESELQSVISNIQANQDFLRSIDRTMFCNVLLIMFMTGVVCLKHEGFNEEREWRAIYLPRLMPSPLISNSLEVIEGVPQMIYKIPLEGRTPDLAEIDLPYMLDRVIIGPSPYPWPMYEAFTAALTAVGITDAGARVFVSGIPIRN
jgi:hypothetical protein